MKIKEVWYKSSDGNKCWFCPNVAREDMDKGFATSEELAGRLGLAVEDLAGARHGTLVVIGKRLLGLKRCVEIVSNPFVDSVIPLELMLAVANRVKSRNEEREEPRSCKGGCERITGQTEAPAAQPIGVCVEESSDGTVLMGLGGPNKHEPEACFAEMMMADFASWSRHSTMTNNALLAKLSREEEA